eukprot:scaffold547_cov99-Isochrysis_galbana.AAC.5
MCRSGTGLGVRLRVGGGVALAPARPVLERALASSFRCGRWPVYSLARRAGGTRRKSAEGPAFLTASPVIPRSTLPSPTYWAMSADGRKRRVMGMLCTSATSTRSGRSYSRPAAARNLRHLSAIRPWKGKQKGGGGLGAVRGKGRARKESEVGRAGRRASACRPPA